MSQLQILLRNQELNADHYGDSDRIAEWRRRADR